MPNTNNRLVGSDGITIHVGNTVLLTYWTDPYVTWDHDVEDGETREEICVVSVRDDGELMIGKYMYRYLDDVLGGPGGGYLIHKINVSE